MVPYIIIQYVLKDVKLARLIMPSRVNHSNFFSREISDVNNAELESYVLSNGCLSGRNLFVGYLHWP